MDSYRIYLVDDHSIMREGLKHILTTRDDLEVIGESGDGRKALTEIDSLKPDLVLLDISLPSMSGVEIARELKKYNPETSILILSRHDNEEYVEQLLKTGIHGYVLKDDAGEDLLRAVDAIRKGETYLSSRITSRLMAGFTHNKKEEGQQSIFQTLTPREREVLQLVAEGLSTEQIATQLRISPRTAKVHRQNIMKKLDLHKVADLVKYAIRTGLVEG